MGCTSEKCIPDPNHNNKKKSLEKEDNIELDLNDIEKQGESKHPQRIIINNNNIEEEEKNYYNYNLKDLIPINKTKMTVKRLENFDEDDDDESENEEGNNNLENIKEDNNDENENENVQNENVQNENNNINEMEEDEDEKKPEDKKPPNIEKLKKKGKDKKDIVLF